MDESSTMHAPTSVSLRVAAAVAVMLLLGGAAGVRAQHPTWQVANAPVRAVFEKRPDRYHTLVHMPAGLTNGAAIGSVQAFGPDGSRPASIVACDSNSLQVLVASGGLWNGAVLTVYGITNGSRAARSTELTDPLPVAVTVQRAGGHDAPPSWESMSFMSNRQDNERLAFLTEGFVTITSDGGRRWYRGGWKKPTYLARMASQLAVTKAGVHRLGLIAPAATYLLIDGKVAASVMGPATNTWSTGPSVQLDAGLHRLEVYTICERQIDVSVGWMPPGSDAVQPLPAGALLTAAGPAACRIEHLDQVLHAAATYDLAPSYRFHGVAPQFTPVVLRSQHAVWEGAERVDCTWSSAGRRLGEGTVLRTTLIGSEPVPVELIVRNGLGMRARAGVTVDLRERAALEYRLVARLYGVPAVCYDDDPVQPEIQVRGTAPDGLPLEVQATLTRPDGAERKVVSAVTLERTWGRVLLPTGCGRDFASLRWDVLHAGVVVSSGSARFTRQPFDRLPSDLDGNLLSDGQSYTVLLPRRASSGHPPPFCGLRGGQRLLILDGFLAPEGTTRVQDGALFDRCVLADLQTLGSATMGLATNEVRYQRVAFDGIAAPLRERTFARLAPLAGLGSVLTPDVVVVAPDFVGWPEGETLGEFERRLAALTGLLSDVMKAKVVLMTPPAGLGLGQMPESGGDDPMRPFAEAVLRVADAYGATVADLYTMSCTRPHAPAVHNGLLTDAGRRLAAETIARTLAR